MIKLNISKNDLDEILEDIRTGACSCPSNWGLENPKCQVSCVTCLIETVLENAEEVNQ